VTQKENISPSVKSDLEVRFSAVSSREVFRETLLELARKNSQIFCLDSDMGGLQAFEEARPHQYADVGIAEANLLSVAAGLAKVGWIPVAHTMASFATSRANEQIKLDIARNNLPVKIVVSHGGVSGGHLGPTHHALEDVALMRSFPNMTIVIPCDAAETEKALHAAIELPGPVYIRLGRKATKLHHTSDFSFQIGKAQIIEDGTDIAIIATGPSALRIAREAATRLEQRNISACVVNCHTIKPLDTDLVLHLAKLCGRIITVEEHSIVGGLGSAVAEFLAREHPTPMRMIGGADYFSQVCGDEQYLLDHLGITTTSILHAAGELLPA